MASKRRMTRTQSKQQRQPQADSSDDEVPGPVSYAEMRPAADKKRLAWRLRWFLIGLIVVTAALLAAVAIEGWYRRNAPDSVGRPSTALWRIAHGAERLFRWIGWQLAWILNVWRFVKDLVIDATALLEPLVHLLISPFYTLRGWYDYYLAAYLNPAVAKFSVVGVAVVATVVGALLLDHYVPLIVFFARLVEAPVRRRVVHNPDGAPPDSVDTADWG